MAGDHQTWKSPQESCNELLKTLRDSNLHFIVSESPYSMQICVRKKFLEQKKSVSSSSGQSVTIGLEKRSEDLAKENVSLAVTLKEANKDIEDLKNNNEILVTKLENAEKEMLELSKEKTENTKKFDDDTALQRAKVKSLEKSLKAMEKKVNNAEKKIIIAHDTITRLERTSTSKTKLDAVEGKIYVGQDLSANDSIKDQNENMLESFSFELETGSKQISCLPLSPTRKDSLTRDTSCAPPSPHTPPGPPPSVSTMSTELQPSATLSCYFPNSAPDLVNESKPITGDYIKNLSKLNLAPRKSRQENT